MDAIQRNSFGTLERDAKRRLANDNDVKILIQGKNSQTGIGKTTLAIELCRRFDENGWDAEQKAFIKVENYLTDFLQMPRGSSLLLDEIGAGADSRRATSTANVELTQGWQLLRSRNVATVATLPSTNMMDPRLLELADWWVLVEDRGLALPHRIKVNDYNGNVSLKKVGGESDPERFTFPDLPDNDDDKNYLDQIKDKKVDSGGMETIKKAEHRKKLEDAREKAAQERRNELIKVLYHNTGMSYANIAELPTIELAKQRVGQIVRGE